MDRIKEKYNQLENKRDFCENVAKVMHYKNGISLETLFRENRINKKHYEEIEFYLDRQINIELDRRNEDESFWNGNSFVEFKNRINNIEVV